MDELGIRQKNGSESIHRQTVIRTTVVSILMQEKNSDLEVVSGAF